MTFHTSKRLANISIVLSVLSLLLEQNCWKQNNCCLVQIYTYDSYGEKNKLSRKEQRTWFHSFPPMFVVKTELLEQVMKLGFLNLAKKISLTSISKLTKDESH
jgi:hypothetical protein